MNRNWELKTLKDVCDNIFAGGDVPKNNFSKFKTNIYNIPIFANGAKDKGLYGFTDIKKVIKPSITVSARGTIGYSEIRNEPFFPIVRLVVLIPNTNIISLEFLKYIIDNMEFKNTGTSIPQLTIPMIAKYEAFIPLLEEQKKIVNILDKAFKSIEQAKANIEKNIENTKELFQSRLNEMFSQKGDDWEEKKLEELSNDKKAIVSGPFGSNLKVADYRDSGVPILRLQNVGKGHFIEKDIKYIDEEKAEELKSHSYVVGDIVLAKLGIPIGKTCIIPETFNDGIILADIVRIRPDRKKVNYQFLEYFLNTDLSVSQLTKNISGATRPRVNLSDVRNIIVPIPPLEIQNKLLVELDKLNEQTKQLEKHYKQKLKNLEELKKSILQKAFSGELLNDS